MDIIKQIKNKILFQTARTNLHKSIRIWSLRALGFEIGNDVYIGTDLTIIGSARVKNFIFIKDRVSIAPNVTFILSSHPNSSRIKYLINPTFGDIIIGEDCWIGTGAIIYPGITIGHYSIVAAGSVVTKNVESYSVVAGAPAKIINRLSPLTPDNGIPIASSANGLNPSNLEKYQWDIENVKGYRNRMGLYKTSVEYSFIKSRINSEHLNIIDIGGGSGRFAIPLSEAGHEVCVVDFNPASIDLLVRKGFKNAIVGNIVDFDGGNFDMALSIELFSLSKPETIIRKAYSLLKDDGQLILAGGNTNSWKYRLRLWSNKSYPTFDLSYEEYKKLLINLGFTDLKITGFNWMPFRVASNNVFIPFLVFLEKLLFLKYWPKQSPWLLIACRKAKQES